MKKKEKQLSIFEKSIGVKMVPYIAIGGGKGGVGKTVVTYLLAKSLTQYGKVLVLDADMGLPDFYILSGIKPKRYLEEFFEGLTTLEDVITPIEEKLDLMSPKSGDDYLLSLNHKNALDLLNKLEEYILDNYDFFLIDLGAGIHKINQLIFSSVDYPVLVSTPNIMSIIDVYAFVKAIFNNYGKNYFYLVVNKANSEKEYKKTANVVKKSVKNISPSIEIEPVGYIPFRKELMDGDLPKALFKYSEEIVKNLLKDVIKNKEKTPKESFWSKLKRFFK
jgi:flagellar biosynthesis protein FlhG